MSDRVFGSVKNGKYTQITLGSYSGMAGVRPSNEGIELAFLGAQPGLSMPIEGTMGNQRIRAVKRKESAIPGMHLFIIEMVD
jgi:hypothetical protein